MDLEEFHQPACYYTPPPPNPTPTHTHTQLGTGEYEIFQFRLDHLNDTQIPYTTAIEKKDPAQEASQRKNPGLQLKKPM